LNSAARADPMQVACKVSPEQGEVAREEVVLPSCVW